MTKRTEDNSTKPRMIQPLSDLATIAVLNKHPHQLDAMSVDKQAIVNASIEAYIVALGSNFEADKHLAKARRQLIQPTDCYQWSSLLINPDYTASKNNPKPDYTNQCGLLTLKTAIPFHVLQEDSKRIEHHCKRRLFTKTEVDFDNSTRIVSIDIDILAVKISGQWRVIRQRHPFKAHEVAGISELLIQLLQT